MIRRHLHWLLLPLAGALAAYVALPNDPIVYHDVVVPARAIEAREPPSRPPTIIERIKFVPVHPIQVATAPHGATIDVATFCAPSVANAVGDTTSTPRSLLIRSGTHSPGWWWGRDRLLLTGPTSDGDLEALDFGVRPGFTFRVVGDSVLVRYPRIAWTRQTVEIGVPFAVGLLLGRLVW